MSKLHHLLYPSVLMNTLLHQQSKEEVSPWGTKKGVVVDLQPKIQIHSAVICKVRDPLCSLFQAPGSYPELEPIKRFVQYFINTVLPVVFMTLKVEISVSTRDGIISLS